MTTIMATTTITTTTMGTITTTTMGIATRSVARSGSEEACLLSLFRFGQQRHM